MTLDAPDAPVAVGRASALTQRRYDRLAPWYDLLEAPLERFVHRPLRRRLAERLPSRGRLLEVGVGTGRNIEFYPPAADVEAIDLSARMLARAAERARSEARSVVLRCADVERLPYADARFDAVFATFLFCSVPDPGRGLCELARVCRPGGTLVLLEHVRPHGQIAGWLADLLDPFLVKVSGAHINRRTVETLRASGLGVLALSTHHRVIRLIEASPLPALPQPRTNAKS